MAKLTQVEAFNKVIDIIDASDIVTPEEKDELVDLFTKKIEMLENKAAKAKAKAAEKEPKPDELADVVLSLVTKTPQTAEEIAKQIVIDGEPVSRQKVSARLTKLAKAGQIVKTERVVPGPEGTKPKTYSAYTIA